MRQLTINSYLSLFLLFLLMIIAGKSLLAQHHHSVSYIENLGQWPEPVLFKAEINSHTSLFIENDGITIHLTENILRHNKYDPSDLLSTEKMVKGLAYKVLFSGSATESISKGKASDDYINYYTSENTNHWRSSVRHYECLTLNNIYPGIDVKFSSDENGIKYNFIVHPGANTSQIQMKYLGITGLYIKNESIHIPCEFANIEEKIPETYGSGKNGRYPLKSYFKLNNNQVSFGIQDYNHSDTLIIDPSLIFSTYSGSSADNWGFTGTFDNEGNVYSGGIVFNTGYPVSLGAYQTSFSGNCDIGIIKYNPAGTQRLFATYLGGTSADLPHSMIANEQGDLYIYGTTGSLNFPVTAGSFDNSFNTGPSLSYGSNLIFPQGADIFISCLSPSGNQLKYSTFIGGNHNDGLHYRNRYNTFFSGNDSLYFNYGDGARGEIILDNHQNVIVGSTSFSSDFPLQNPFQSTRKGQQDGVVFKMNPQLSGLLWSSYLGGNNDDAIYSVDVDEDNRIYCTGGTLSQNFPVTNSAYKTSYQGGSADGFLSCISENGQQLIASTYFGSAAYDQCFFIRTDKKGSVYVFGQTKASGNSLIYNAAYKTPNSGQFIARLPYNLQTINWSTVFGTGDGKPNISPTAFMIDKCRRIYVSGWGRIFGNSVSGGVFYPWGSTFGTVNMMVTPDAIQSQTDGQDFYVAVIGKDASHLEYATFFGELYYPTCPNSGRDHVDGGTSRFDPAGNIIQSVCASCGGCQQFPTSPNPGAWSNTNMASNCNNAIFKMNLRTDVAIAAFDQPQPACAPSVISFQNRSLGTSYLWNFGDPSSGSLNTSNEVNPTHLYQNPGNYTVQLISYFQGSCNLSDTAYRTLYIGSSVSQWLDSTDLCGNTTATLGWTGVPPANTTFNWTPVTGLSAANIQNPQVSAGTSALYTCIMQTPACQDTFYQYVYASPFDATAGPDTITCNQDYTLIASSSMPGTSFLWSSNPLFSDTLNNYPNDSTLQISAATSFTNYYLKAAGSDGCIIIDSIRIEFIYLNVYISNPGILCKGDTAHIHAISLSPPHNNSYEWYPADYILGSANNQTVIILPDTSFWLYLKTETSEHCTSLDSLWIQTDLFNAKLLISQADCNGRCTGTARVHLFNGLLPYHIQWSTGDTTRSIRSLCPGSYFVNIHDNNGCDTSIHFEISSPPPYSISSTVNNPLCYGEPGGTIMLTVSGASPPYSFQWSNGSQSQNQISLVAGTYSVTITDQRNCDTTLIFILTQPPALSASVVANNVLCYGQTNGSILLTPQGGQPPYQITWSNGMTGNQINGLSAGFYTAQIQDQNGCDTLITIEITQAEALIAHASLTHPTCYNSDDGMIEINASGGVAPYSIQWQNGSNQWLLSYLYAGEYNLAITDANQCVLDTSYYLSAPPAFSVISIVKNISCKGYDDGSIQCEVQGGSPPYQFQWSNGFNTSIISNLTAGNYEVRITDNQQCDTLINFQVLEADDSLSLTLIARNPACFGGSDGKITALISGGQAPFHFEWNTGSTSSILNNLTAGNYHLNMMDSFGCSRSDSIELLEYPKIEHFYHITNQSCAEGEPDGAIQIDFTGGLPPYAYLWSNGFTTKDLSAISAGLYSLEMTDAASCKTRLTLEVKSPPLLTFNVELYPPACYGMDNGSLIGNIAGGTPPYLVQWNTGSTQMSLSGLTSGTYTVHISDKVPCYLEESYFLSQPDSISIQKYYSPEVCRGFNDGFIELDILGGTPPYVCTWNYGTPGLKIEYLAAGWYFASILDAAGCLYSDSTLLPEKDCDLFIPNVITPNYDGYNDYFVILNIEYYPQNELVIINRWGKEVIKYTGYHNQWDGRDFNGNKVSDGVYYYLLNLGTGKIYKGSISVLR